MPISSGVLWMVYADTAFLRKLERHNLCPLATIPRHRCGQRVYNCGQKPCIAPPRCPKLPSTPDACYRELRRIPILETVWKVPVRVEWHVLWQREEPKKVPFRTVVQAKGATKWSPFGLSRQSL